MAEVVKVESNKASVLSRGANWIQIRVDKYQVKQSIKTGKHAVLKSGWWADPQLLDLGEIQEAKRDGARSVIMTIVNF